ncbi:leucine-zipper-like transcriptional regulator 1 homolog [Takifugu rubripes]|uniref:Leucine-zipper-like transcriptional regulator 1 homolog n=1 Tax=Takifugu rubripes TaxID=31033 RepID=A0A3B5K6Q1_TAKRU|nr:leucine-zipper-like transcriptional regulator 1 homolog [Takifugu rubripes]XP_029693741.1 leucine-zipper-like transcriptional regulator 1 homolog [Takifugu rubripes]XP_029693780.1 leucine-zipper-like transcriptional regulator 1 homolog [Takifugu rubripes]XP_029693818.1 leucine-zipper-like transcriptional regulator 1 homolog [Takifugu rubripes]|eukprot:XP_003962221.1 PREDICTED: multiple epidermal growth factor-like domains protein 8 [Takifugu rubripes]
MNQNGPSLWTQLPQSSRAPRDRYKHACCSSDGHVYVLGGRDSSCLRDLWRYSVVCNEWTELNCRGEAAPEELEEHSMVAHEGFLYVFGGLLDSAYSNSRYPLWLFDIAKQKWMNCRGKSGSTQTQTPSNRKGHSSVVVGSAMLVYGGFVDLKGSSQDFWSLDFDSMAWSLLSDSQHGSVGPGCRHGHSAVAHQSCMYLFGGLKGLREQRDFWKWNSTSCTWTSLRNKSGPSRLTGHSAVAYRDGMLLFGGGESQHSPSSCLWRYSFTSLTWTQVATLPGSSPPKKIHHSCIGLGPSYKSNSHSSSSGSGIQTRLLESRMRPFKNKCFPAPLSFLGSDGAIELETFSQDQCYDTKLRASELIKNGTQQLGNCLTFENKAFGKKSSDDEEDGDAALHLPDLLLVLGGRPCSSHGPISVWQMTLTDS